MVPQGLQYDEVDDRSFLPPPLPGPVRKGEFGEGGDSSMRAEGILTPLLEELDLPPGMQDDEVDDGSFLPPPLPGPVRRGELGEEENSSMRGEGFWTPLLEEPDRLRGSDLNEWLQPGYLERLRFINFPLQAYGMLFKWEVLIDDALEVDTRPWVMVASANNLRVPDNDAVLRAMAMLPERAITQVFRWTDDIFWARQLAGEYYEARAEVVRSHDFKLAEGALEWLEILKKYEVPCCFCAGTSLDRTSAEQLAARAGFDHLIHDYVTLEDLCETPEQTYLVASIKLRRPPEKCAVFEDNARGVAAAHDATAKAVAVFSSVAVKDELYKMRSADLRVNTFNDLTLFLLRELFKGTDEPLVKEETDSEPLPPRTLLR